MILEAMVAIIVLLLSALLIYSIKNCYFDKKRKQYELMYKGDKGDQGIQGEKGEQGI